MARNFSPRRQRNRSIPSPQQRIISQYFTPRSGISKEEVNFLVKPNPVSRDEKTRPTCSVQETCTDKITFSTAFGFTTAAKLHQQLEKWCSGAQKQRSLPAQHAGSTTYNSAVCEEPSWTCSPLRNNSIEKQQHMDIQTLAANFMASSTSSSSTTPTASSTSSTSQRNVRQTRAQKRLKGKPAKKQKNIPETITVDSEDEKSSVEDDCCFIVNVVRGKRKSGSDVEESASCSQSSSCADSSSQSSQISNEETSSHTSCSESDQKQTVSSCKKSSLSSKTAKQPKEHTSGRSTFGLVGGDVSDSDDDDDVQDLSQCDSEFAQLPVEIMENIFCQLPIVDLMLNCTLVCRQWYNIISRDSVIAHFQKECKPRAKVFMSSLL